MNAKKNTKLCWNCEGELDRHALQCLYCGVNLNTAAEEIKSPASPMTPQAPKFIAPAEPLRPFSYPPYSKSEVDWATSEQEETDEREDLTEAEGGKILSWPFALLLSGIVLTLFALILLLFSTEGVLTLRWNARYWFVYLLLALPLLIFGWKFLKEEN